MRILQILGGAGDKYGSMERFIVELCAQAAQRSFTIDIIMVNKPASRFFDGLQGNVASLVHIPCKGPYDLGFWRQVCIVTKRIQPDIAHTHYDRANLLGPFVMKLCGVSHVFQYFHNSFVDRGGIRKRMYFFAAKHFVSLMYCVSEQIRNQLVEFGMPPSLVEVQALGLDLSLYNRPHQTEINNTEKRPLQILTVADARPEKGLDILIQAFSRAKVQVADMRLCIVGDGPLLEHVQTLAESLGIQDSVNFLGRRDDVPMLLSQGDLYIQPSLSEGRPLAVMEAMATGLPIIASNVGGIPDLLEHKVSGFLVPSGDADCLAAAIIQLIDDPALRESLGKNAYNKSRNFDLEKSVQILLDQYSSVCENTSK